MTSNSEPRASNHTSVYTIGLYRIKGEDFSKLLSLLHIDHVFDVRSNSKQKAPIVMRPSSLLDLVTKNGGTYHDESGTLGDRPNYQLFALSEDFSRAMQSIIELGRQSNLLVVCSEPNYRKCHRRFIASFLSRSGLAVHHLGKGFPSNFQPTLEAIASRPLNRRMFTLGFTRKSMREFSELLRSANVSRLVDIRLRPVSQYSGFAKKDDLEFLLELLGIQYVHTRDLAPTDDMLDNFRSNSNWGNYQRQFMTLLKDRRPDALLDQLITPGMNVAFLCTEDLPDFCHRRLVAEYAKRLFPEMEVIHLTSKGTLRDGSLNVSPLLSR